MNWNQFPILEKAFQSSGTANLFECSDDARWRIVKGMNTLLNRKYSPEELLLFEKNAKKTEISFVRRISFVVISMRTLFIYFSLATLVWWRSKQNNNKTNCATKTQIVLMNSAGAVNRFSDRLGSVLNNFSTDMFFIFNKNLLKMSTVSNEKDVKVLIPRFPDIRTISGLAQYALFHAARLEEEIHNAMAIPTLETTMRPIHEFICANVVHQFWADYYCKYLSEYYPMAIFLFDQGGDTGGKETFLIDKLNAAGRTTIVLQHGTLSDPLEYKPLANTMLTCSIREREALINVGSEASRLHIIGAPIQTIADSIVTIKNPAKPCDILILATDEFLWLEKDLISVLQKSKELHKGNSKALRYHPSFSNEEKQLWCNGLPAFEVRKGYSLAQEIVTASIIITFSLDAMISCLRRGKRTILGLHPSVYERKDFLRFRELPGVPIISTFKELDKALEDLQSISEGHFQSLVTPAILTEHFGTSDPEEIRNAFNTILENIIVKNQ